MDHLSLFSYSQGQIKAGMKFAPGALADGLSTGALHRDEAAAEKGLFVKDLGETGSSPTFRIGQVASRAHKGSPPFEFVLIYLYISEITGLSSFFLNANLLGVAHVGLSYGIYRRGTKKKNRFTEFLPFCQQRRLRGCGAARVLL
jgi:hypothetical protein